MQTNTDLKSLAVRYIDAAGGKDYEAVAQVLTPDVSFKGPFMGSDSAQAFIGSLRRMAPIWERNLIRRVFADGDEACVVYDFVTNTPAGSLPCIELLKFRGDRIESIELFFDREGFAPAREALMELVAK